LVLKKSPSGDKVNLIHRVDLTEFRWKPQHLTPKEILRRKVKVVIRKEDIAKIKDEALDDVEQIDEEDMTEDYLGSKAETGIKDGFMKYTFTKASNAVLVGSTFSWERKSIRYPMSLRLRRSLCRMWALLTCCESLLQPAEEGEETLNFEDFCTLCADADLYEKYKKVGKIIIAEFSHHELMQVLDWMRVTGDHFNKRAQRDKSLGTGFGVQKWSSGVAHRFTTRSNVCRRHRMMSMISDEIAEFEVALEVEEKFIGVVKG
jgi:hypothetical protein